MNHYEISREEKEYLAGYDITRYDRPSVAADIAIFSVMEDGLEDNFRKLPKQALKILLVKRESYPYKGYYALPGSFCRRSEDVCETAKRELQEETHIGSAYLRPVGIFGESGRDPRGWIISNTFMALVDGGKYALRDGEDAWEAKWFSLQIEVTGQQREVGVECAKVETEYLLTLFHAESDTTLSAKVRECKRFENYHETSEYEILQSEGIAFDHAKIILHALMALRKNVESDLKVAFDLLPEMFTLTKLQNVFELVLGQELVAANFRRKIAEYVIETECTVEGAGHRPAKLFKRNVEQFYR